MGQRRRRSFTLMELLVVIGIIVILTALSIPSISKFLEGQSLLQSGRIVQSAFNEARRAAITQREDNYIIIFRSPDPDRIGEFRWGLRRYREGVGYEGEAHYLLPGVEFDVAPGTGAGTLNGSIKYVAFDGEPAQDSAPFNGTFNADTSAGTWIIFRRDGGLSLTGGSMTDSAPPTFGSGSIFDRNNADVDTVDFATFNTWVAQCDFNLKKTFDNPAGKRCFIDISALTGQVKIRAVKPME